MRNKLLKSAFIAVMFLFGGYAIAADEAVVSAGAEEIINPICPVMHGTVNPDLFVEYKGKKVYFCCPGCSDTFNANPEKYIASLPQFTAGAGDGNEKEEGDLSTIIVSVGIGVLIIITWVAFKSSSKKSQS